MGIGARLAKLKAAADERGPVVQDEDEFENEPARPAMVQLAPLHPDVLFPKTPAERARVARNNAGLDCETFLIQPGRNTPRLVVTGYQAPDGRQAIVTGVDVTTEHGTTSTRLADGTPDPAAHACAFLAFTDGVLKEAFALLRVGANEKTAPASINFIGSLLLNQNIAFDFCAIAEDAHQADVTFGLVGQPESWFEAVMSRIFEMLDLNIVEDTMLRERLIDLAEGTLGKDFASLTEKGNPRRKLYNLKVMAQNYLGVELDKLTFRLGYGQFHNKPIHDYPDGAVTYLTDDVESALHVASRQMERARLHGLPEGSRIPNSAEQTKAAFSLNLISSWGMRTDLSKVQQLDADLDHTARTMLRVLQKTGIVRETGRDAGTQDLKRTHELVKNAYESKGLVVPRTESGKNISTAGSVLEDIALIMLRGHSRDVLDAQGRVDETELMEQPLYALSQYKSIQKLQNTYLPVLYSGTKHPINTRFETILETGRISSYKPNLNNLPRGGEKTLLARLQARVRKCFVPRDGFLFCSVDYAALELCTLAQCLLWFFGHSKMADAINAGFDLHTLFAAEQLLHITYEEALSRKKEQTLKDMRQLAKVCNFGLGGGMGAESMKEFASATYNVDISVEEARELKQKWLTQWPEMRLYFKTIASMMRGFDDRGVPVGDVEQFVSGRIRGRARYCALANSLFQGLASDGAKTALYALQKECYLQRGRLYGSRVVAFFYDEFFMEHPIETAAERAEIQAEIAVREMQQVCVDVKIGAEPALQECWMKEAEPVFNVSGRLIPWKSASEQTEDFYDRGGKIVSAMRRIA